MEMKIHLWKVYLNGGSESLNSGNANRNDKIVRQGRNSDEQMHM